MPIISARINATARLAASEVVIHTVVPVASSRASTSTHCGAGNRNWRVSNVRIVLACISTPGVNQFVPLNSVKKGVARRSANASVPTSTIFPFTHFLT